MIHGYIRLTGCVLLAALCWTCRSVTELTPPDTTDYFPLETSRYSLYDVTEQRYSLTTTPVSLTYQLKEVTGPAYTDVTGQPAYRWLRYRRATDNQPWQLDSVWSVRRTLSEAIRTESGRPIVKLVFPVVAGTHWNANKLNTAGADDYELRNVGLPYSVSGRTFGETATVLQQTDSTLVGLDQRREVYARTVGMIYKEVIQVRFCTATPDCLGKQQIEYGLQQTYRIRSYGRE